MNVRDLIKELSVLDPDLPVIVAARSWCPRRSACSGDEEGNRFLPLEEVEYSGAIERDHEWQVLHPDDEDEYTDELVRVVVLWP